MRRRSRRPISDINVVPYLDVMLVLLVIFMVTAPLFNQGVVDLPNAGEDTKTRSQKADALEVFYTADGGNSSYHIYDHGRGVETERMNLPRLVQTLKEETLLRPSAPLVISADGVLSYEQVVRLLGRLQSEGFATVAIKIKTGE